MRIQPANPREVPLKLKMCKLPEQIFLQRIHQFKTEITFMYILRYMSIYKYVQTVMLQKKEQCAEKVSVCTCKSQTVLPQVVPTEFSAEIPLKINKLLKKLYMFN